MKRVFFALVFSALGALGSVQSAETRVRDIYPDTWVATDALGRTMPTYEEVGPVKKDQRRVVGIFYVTLHRDSLSQRKSPYAADVSKILAKDPSARLDAKHPLWPYPSYHWGEPEAGYFLSKDEYVIRKDLSMLADAGVDVMVMDVTNAVRYWDEWSVIFPVMEKMKAEGNKVPQFCFWAFGGPVITVVQSLYDKIYKQNQYQDLWFMWEGKPLLLYKGRPEVATNGKGTRHPNPHYDPQAKTDPSNPHYGDPDYAEEFYKDYTREVKSFFTLRTMWWGYQEWAGKPFVGTEDNWSFGYDLADDRNKVKNPDALVSRHNGRKEEAAVTPAQHPGSLVGKCWTREKGEPELNDQDLPVPTYVPWLGKTVQNPEGYGIYFQQRWDEAIAANPQFVYINDWNEWTGGKYQAGGSGTTPFMRRNSPYYFGDQYNAEFNRCLQPMKGGYTDNYYMQMAQNIRRYKGIHSIPVNEGLTTPKVDGKFGDWAQVKVEYRDTIGDVFHRDYKGYGDLHYTNDSGRNDLVVCKVAVDNKKVYFYVQTDKALTPHTDNNWMLLLIDADADTRTGWSGYDYIINKSGADERHTTIMRYDALNLSDPWLPAGQVDFRYADNKMELAVPRQLLGLVGDKLVFDFHWADNPTDLKDPMSLCVSGDSAPNRKFNYRCIWQK